MSLSGMLHTARRPIVQCYMTGSVVLDSFRGELALLQRTTAAGIFGFVEIAELINGLGDDCLPIRWATRPLFCSRNSKNAQHHCLISNGVVRALRWAVP